jgi:hypothetical protein
VQQQQQLQRGLAAVGSPAEQLFALRAALDAVAPGAHMASVVTRCLQCSKTPSLLVHQGLAF